MNTRAPYHVIMGRQIGSDLLVTHADCQTAHEVVAITQDLNVRWYYAIIVATGDLFHNERLSNALQKEKNGA